MAASLTATFVASPATKRPNVDLIRTLLDLQRTRNCVAATQKPSVQMYYTLKQRIDGSDLAWLREFLHLDGLRRLLDTICEMTCGDFTNFSDAILQLDCIACIRSALNRKVGMEFLLERPDYVIKLVNVLSTVNTMPKKQILEILTAICAYSNTGLQLVMSSLEQYKKRVGQQHRFGVVLSELTLADITMTYKTAVMSFVNCFVNCHRDLYDRVRIRTQLSGLGLDSILYGFRRQEFDADLHTQIEIYEENKFKDDAALQRQTQMDVDDSCQLFDLIYSKVFGGHKHTYFLQILQDLALLEISRKQDSETKWEKIADHVHQLTAEDENADCSDVIHKHCLTCEHCCVKVKPDMDSLTPSTIQGEDSTLKSSTITASLAMAQDILDLTPEYDALRREKAELPREAVTGPEGGGVGQVGDLLGLKWVALTKDMLEKYDEPTLWDRRDVDTRLGVDAGQLEELFVDETVTDMLDNEVQLVDGQVALKINLILHRLDTTPDDLAASLLCHDTSLDTWTLRCLSAALPAHEEVSSLHRYNGPLSLLDHSDQFLLRLSSSVDYRVQVEGELMVRELTDGLRSDRAGVATMTRACRQIIDSHSLARFLRFILLTGNILNSKKFNGSAVGFKLSTLSRLEDVKSTRPKMTLLRYLVSEATLQDPAVFKFVAELSSLDKASRCNLDDLTRSVSDMHTRWRDMQPRLMSGCQDTQRAFQPAIDSVNEDLYSLQSGLCELKLLSTRLAQYLCEDENEFDMSACFLQLSKFVTVVHQCRIDIKTSKKDAASQLLRAPDARPDRREWRMTLEFGRDAGASSSILEDRSQIVETVLSQVHRGRFTPPDAPADSCVTPEQEDVPWELSCISPGGGVMSPVCMPPLARMDTFLEFDSSTKCTNSVDDLLACAPSPIHPNLAPPVTTPGLCRRKLGTLYRSHSDLDLAAARAGNWVAREGTTVERVRRQASLDPLDLSVNECRSPAMLVAGPELKLPKSMKTTIVYNPTYVKPGADNGGFKVPVPSTWVNRGPAGNKLASNFKREYRGASDGVDAAARSSKKRASIMGNIVNRFTRVVLRPRNSGEGRMSRKERGGGGQETGVVSDGAGDAKASKDRRRGKENKGDCNVAKEKEKENKGDGRRSFKSRFSRARGKENKENKNGGEGRESVKGVVWQRIRDGHGELTGEGQDVNDRAADNYVASMNEKLV